MDLLFIFNTLWNRKWLLIGTIVATTLFTYFLLRLVAPNYKSEAIIQTSITERKKVDLERESPFMQQFQVKTLFSNLITRMTSRTSLKKLAYQLLLHDLEALVKEDQPFRTPDAEEWQFNAQEAKNIIHLIHQELSGETASKEAEPKIRQVAYAFGYNYNDILEQLNVVRDGETDYLLISAISENPTYSAFLVNTLCDNFVQQYNQEYVEAESTSVQFYHNLAKQKKSGIDSVNQRISEYKQRFKILDLKEESGFLIAEKKDLELAKEEEKKNIEGLKKAIKVYDEYLEGQNFSLSRTDAGTLLLRSDVAALKSEKAKLQEQYNLTGRYDDDIQREIKKIDKKLDEQLINLATERLQKSERNDKDDNLKTIFFKRLDTEVDLLISEESVKSIENALNRLENETVGFVESEAILQNLEGEKDILLGEYLDVVNKLNEATRIALSSSTPLQVIEYGEVAEKPESSKALIITALAAITAAGAVALLLIFLALLDNRLTEDRFETLTQLPLSGTLSTLKLEDRALDQIFFRPTQNIDEQVFREEIRRIRLVIESAGAKKFLFTSLGEKEGKTFLIITLAYAFSVMRKKILIVDTNFKNNELTVLANKVLADNPLYNEVINKDNATINLDTIWELDDNIHILGNQGGNFSPSELFAGRNFEQSLENISKKYDYIFMESAAINAYNDAQELIPYTDKVITVFKANQKLSEASRNSIKLLNKLDKHLLGAILNFNDKRT